MGCCGPSFNKQAQTRTSEVKHALSPLDLLKIRLAKGEITIEEYEKTKAALTEKE